jgi:serine protease Do
MTIDRILILLIAITIGIWIAVAQQNKELTNQLSEMNTKNIQNSNVGTVPTSKPVAPVIVSKEESKKAYTIDSKKNSPFVVVVSVGMRQQAEGSGFYVAKNLVMTSNHTLKFDKTTVNGYSASIVFRNINRDVAILKVREENSNYLKFSKSPIVQGDPVSIISNPLNLENTLSVGIVSNTYRMINSDQFSTFQFSAPVSHGSSGAAVLNAKDEIIGMVRSSFDNGQLLNFAIPFDQLQQDLRDMGPTDSEENAYRKDSQSYNYYTGR